jgi:hypothetical protein
MVKKGPFLHIALLSSWQLADWHGDFVCACDFWTVVPPLKVK